MFFVLAGIPISNSGCPNQWIPHRQHCYRQFNLAKTWTNAGHWCSSYSSTIAAIQTLSDKQLFRQLIKTERSCFYLSHVGFVTDESLKEIFGVVNLRSDIHKRCVCSDRKENYRMVDCGRECSFMCKKDRGKDYKNVVFSRFCIHVTYNLGKPVTSFKTYFIERPGFSVCFFFTLSFCICSRWFIPQCSLFVWCRAWRPSFDRPSSIYSHCTKSIGVRHRMPYIWSWVPIIQLSHHRNPSRIHMRIE